MQKPVTITLTPEQKRRGAILAKEKYNRERMFSFFLGDMIDTLWEGREK